MVPKTLRRVAINTTSLLTGDLTTKATTFIVYALVGRYLGTVAFGQLSLALTFFYIFQVCAVAGLRSLIIREVAKDKTTTSQYLLHGSIIVGVFSLGSFAILVLVVWLMGYATDTAFCILLLSLGLFPYALATVCESVLQAWEQMHYLAYVQVSVHVMKVLLVFGLLWQGYGLYPLLGVLLAAHLAIAVLEWGVIRRSLTLVPVRIDPQFCWSMLKAASTFLKIDLLMASGSMDILLLSKLGSERDVAFYNAARQVLVPLLTVYINLMLSLFPLFCRKYTSSFREVQELCEHMIEVLLLVVLPVVLGVFFLADAILLLLYGDKFVPASVVLRILVWHLPLMPLSGLLDQVLVVSKHEKTMLRIVTIDWVVNGVGSIILISTFGLIGTALNSLLVRLVDVYLHYAFVSRQLANLRVLRLSWKPIVASLCMTIPLLGISHHSRILAILCAGVVYVAVVLTAMLWESGGIAQLKTRYLSLWVE